jgi:hypothetical protein
VGYAVKLSYRRTLDRKGFKFISRVAKTRDSVLRWFRGIEYYRFIAMMNLGALGADGKDKAHRTGV